MAIGVVAAFALGMLLMRVLASRGLGQGSGIRGPETTAEGAGEAAPAAKGDTKEASAASDAAKAERGPVKKAARAPGEADPESADEDTNVASRAALLARAAATVEDEGPEVELSDGEEGEPTMPLALILVSAIGRTDTGLTRSLNEDSYLALPEKYLYVIADGMGGHAAGEVASGLAVDTIARAFEHGRFDGVPDASRPRRGDELVRAIQMANAVIYAQAQANEQQAGMGTTLIAAHFLPNKRRVYVAHVGDSRCYRLRDGKLARMTRDHTLGEALGIRGKGAGKLTRAVGVEPQVEVDLLVDSPEPGDYYLLCSDGLSRMVPDDGIRDVVLAAPNIEKACQDLIAAANARGGKDNITVILVRIDEPAQLGNVVGET
jgi:protein phosphatase